MENNELNRRLRYALQLDDAQAQRLMALAGSSPDPEQVAAWRCKEGEAGYLPCPAAAIHALLNGLILDRRGPPETKPENPTDVTPLATPADAFKPVDNNQVLKLLRIALSLKSDDVFELVTAGGGKIGKTETGAFFRKTSARNYRRCGDQVIRWFLTGLTTRRDT